ncbi:MAG: biotin--[acetyl-CoA-carboxylase] ligase [Glaciihabitans sp.]|nr:biotin--[acetyl-CoA-carboxylase] ligase [Glaciihabitans sp.]
MEFPRSSAIVDAEHATVDYREQTGSTNDDLLAKVAISAHSESAHSEPAHSESAQRDSTQPDSTQRDSAALPSFSVVATTNQTAGRGRLGRAWIAPPGQTLAASTLLRPTLPGGAPLPLDAYGWLPLMAGLAMTRAVTAVLPDADAARVSLKWPNDVLISGKKVAGLLAELLPTADGVVIGSGVNLAIPAAELPTETSTSLQLEGVQLEGAQFDGTPPGDAQDLADAVLAGYLQNLRSLLADFTEAKGDAVASGLRDAVSERCSSLGARVRVELPEGSNLVGIAVELDSSGRLVVKRASDGSLQAVAAGDVTHLRYE